MRQRGTGPGRRGFASPIGQYSSLSGLRPFSPGDRRR